jgi:hypothetical protein
MRNVKLKAGTTITLASQLAPLGKTGSGATIFEVTNVPDEISNYQVWHQYRNCFAGYFGNSVAWKQ